MIRNASKTNLELSSTSRNDTGYPGSRNCQVQSGRLLGLIWNYPQHSEMILDCQGWSGECQELPKEPDCKFQGNSRSLKLPGGFRKDSRFSERSWKPLFAEAEGRGRGSDNGSRQRQRQRKRQRAEAEAEEAAAGSGRVSGSGSRQRQRQRKQQRKDLSDF